MNDKSVERARLIGKRHSQAEEVRDLAATIATVIEDPVYEFQPMGLVMRGRDKVEAYYRHLFESFNPSVESAELISFLANSDSVAEEYQMGVRVDGVLEQIRVLGIMLISADEDLLTGERIWGSERAIRLMMGDDVYDSLEPLHPDS